MTKGQKSSATSGTRKKNARKAAQAAPGSSSAALPPPSPVPKPSKPKGGKGPKLSKREAREQRKKVYIPPVKPAPAILDPLDTTGLAHSLPPELVVILRSLGKKDAVTRGKAIEELAKSVEDAIKEQALRDDGNEQYEEDGGKADMMVKMLPVWLNRAPVLFTHSARRIRQLAASLHLSLLRINPAREALLTWTNEIASQEELEVLLGTWAMLAHDIDRGVGTVGLRTWLEFIVPTSNRAEDEHRLAGSQARFQPKITLYTSLFTSLLGFSYQTVLDPLGLHTALNPAPVLPAVTPAQQGKKGSHTPQSQQKKGGRYIPTSPSPTAASVPDRVTGDNVDEENDSDRAGRLRVGALGVIRYLLENWPLTNSAHATDHTTLIARLSSPVFWSCLHPTIISTCSTLDNQQTKSCPFSITSFGQGQPAVRQATWVLVGSLVRIFQDKLPVPVLRTLSTAVLRSAWVETDSSVRTTLGGPLMLFLKDYSQGWVIDAENGSKGYDDLDANVKGVKDDPDPDSEPGSDSDPDPETDNDNDDIAADALDDTPPDGHAISEAYMEFLQFLELGCAGSPAEGYPLVLVVLAGIPTSILPTALPPALPIRDKGEVEPGRDAHPISQLLSSFWAPLDAGLLDRRPATSSWLKALCECLVLIIRRGVCAENTITERIEDAKCLLASQFSRLGTDLVTRRLRVEETEAGMIISRAAEQISRVGDDLFDASFDALCSVVFDTLHTSPVTRDIAPTFLHIFRSTFSPENHAGQKAHSVIEIYSKQVIEALEPTIRSLDGTSIVDTGKDPFAALVKLVNVFGPSLFDAADFASRTDTLFASYPVTLLRVSSEGVLTYLRHRSTCPDRSQGEAQTQIFWTNLLDAIASSQLKIGLSLLSSLVGATVPLHLRGTSAAMDELVEHLVDHAIGANSQGDEESTVARVLCAPASFISSDCLAAIASVLSDSISTFSETGLRFAGMPLSELDEAPDLAGLRPTVELVKKLADSGYEFTGDIGAEFYAGIFLLSYVVPYEGESSGSKWVDATKSLWRSFLSKEGDREQELREVVGSLVKEKLKRIVVDHDVETRPEYIIRCITPSPPGIEIDPLKDILPPREELDLMLESPLLPSSAACPSLALFDPTLPTLISTPTLSNSTCKKYARAVTALLTHLSTSRAVARSNLWALRHILVLGFYANEYLRVDEIQDSLMTVQVTRGHLEDVVEKVKSLTTYPLGRVDDDIHAKVVNALMSGNNAVPVEDGSLASFVFTIARCTREKDKVRDAALLGTVLQHLFSDATKADADLWLTFARRLEKSAPQTAITILASITAYAPEPPKLDRYRNELAASLIGVPREAAITTGLVTLRLLAATASDPDSDIVFLPQQRAVNVMKACLTWFTDDDDDDDDDFVNEELQSAMTLVFLHIAPILQNVPGTHWDLIRDLVESNLEECSLDDSIALTLLGRTLRLVIIIEDLTLTNKPLRESWDETRVTALGLIKDLVMVNTTSLPYSEPRRLCLELALTIIEDMPSTMMTEKTLSRLCHLLQDQSQEVQRMGYRLLNTAARKRTEHYVIEAGVDTEDTVKPELPSELLSILQQSLDLGEAVELDEYSIARNKAISGYLLAWMITFDLFTDASMTVRSGYFNHMRSLDIVSRHFIPNVFEVLSLFSGGKRNFKLEAWAVDDFYLESFEPESALSLQLLAAHLYYRALLTVPALIRSWISDCTDRQLLTRVVDYTSSYFSPGIIKAELLQVRHPDPSSELLTTENLTVKVSQASGEVTALYMVDEQALELSIRMPNDWPLHRLEVRDTKMVGVSEDKWRAWVLGVQQIVWQQNGRIVDGLTLFTKNVTLHFSGQVECAICYSIISVMDASLPQKPCKTCKNRFHASCLYKWFKTSHSSSCPLCRSDIL